MTKSATRAMDAIQEFAACGFCGSYKAWKTAGEPAAGQPLKGGERARKRLATAIARCCRASSLPPCRRRLAAIVTASLDDRRVLCHRIVSVYRHHHHHVVRHHQTLKSPALFPAGVGVQEFVVGGASKRGWTTWTTGVSDVRVAAIIPTVMYANRPDHIFG